MKNPFVELAKQQLDAAEYTRVYTFCGTVRGTNGLGSSMSLLLTRADIGEMVAEGYLAPAEEGDLGENFWVIVRKPKRSEIFNNCLTWMQMENNSTLTFDGTRAVTMASMVKGMVGYEGITQEEVDDAVADKTLELIGPSPYGNIYRLARCYR